MTDEPIPENWKESWKLTQDLLNEVGIMSTLIEK